MRRETKTHQNVHSSELPTARRRIHRPDRSSGQPTESGASLKQANPNSTLFRHSQSTGKCGFERGICRDRREGVYSLSSLSLSSFSLFRAFPLPPPPLASNFNSNAVSVRLSLSTTRWSYPGTVTEQSDASAAWGRTNGISRKPRVTEVAGDSSVESESW